MELAAVDGAATARRLLHSALDAQRGEEGERGGAPLPPALLRCSRDKLERMLGALQPQGGPDIEPIPA